MQKLAILCWLKAHTLGVLSFVFSTISFFYVNYDRRVKLVIRARKGEWCVLNPTVDGKETVLRGIIEVYNHSSRPNTIVSYRFYTDNNGIHEEFESEPCSNDERKFNITPFTVPPYSGAEVAILAFIKGKHTLVMNYLPVMIEIEDVFGKRYSAEVRAVRGQS